MYVLWQQRLRCLYANLRVVRITFSNATTRTQAHTSTSRGEQIICVWYYQTCIRSPFVQCIRNHMLSGYIQLIQREREETVKGGGGEWEKFVCLRNNNIGRSDGLFSVEIICKQYYLRLIIERNCANGELPAIVFNGFQWKFYLI